MAKKGIDPVTAGVVGAAVGAAIGVAAVELTDKKKMGQLKSKGKKAYTELKRTATEVSGKLGKLSK